MKTHWRVYPLTHADQQQHIEQSEHFLATIQPDDPPILYWSQARPDGLVLGFSQQSESLNQSALTATPLPIYRRRAGGTAVLVGAYLLDLDVILPPNHPLALPDIVESYRWFGTAWVATLQHLGISSRTITPAEAHAQAALRKHPATSAYESLMQRACYGSLSPYEVISEQADLQRKVVGLCMIRRRSGTLLQAGVVLHWDSERLAQLLGQTPQEQDLLRIGLPARVVGLDCLAPRVINTTEVISAFEQTLFASV